ncbi:unnamed protein product [Protopolystoma xenopodis]|uniref:Uncharacterized protein n=1 Tax=Protopolystoma xenopodis TaxID=117903 RepID=A0A448XHP6_9PLAT|nr:unnamed protein product [Protopolystoma xenopodis]
MPVTKSFEKCPPASSKPTLTWTPEEGILRSTSHPRPGRSSCCPSLTGFASGTQTVEGSETPMSDEGWREAFGLQGPKGPKKRPFHLTARRMEGQTRPGTTDEPTGN